MLRAEPVSRPHEIAADRSQQNADRYRRRSLGIYYTPRNAADLLAAWAIRNPADTVLEPSFGGCSLLAAASDTLGLVLETVTILRCCSAAAHIHVPHRLWPRLSGACSPIALPAPGTVRRPEPWTTFQSEGKLLAPSQQAHHLFALISLRISGPDLARQGASSAGCSQAPRPSDARRRPLPSGRSVCAGWSMHVDRGVDKISSKRPHTDASKPCIGIYRYLWLYLFSFSPKNPISIRIFDIPAIPVDSWLATPT